MKSIDTLLGFTPVTNARTLTINGTAYDLSADRSWTVTASNGVSSLRTSTNQSNSTTTVTNITGFSISASANKIYEIWGCVYMSNPGTTAGGGIGFSLDLPTGFTNCNISFIGTNTANNGYNGQVLQNTSTTTGGFGYNNILTPVYIFGTVTTSANTGTIQFKYVSRTNGQLSTIFSNSWLKYTEI
jgi:hypothetical protein